MHFRKFTNFRKVVGVKICKFKCIYGRICIIIITVLVFLLENSLVFKIVVLVANQILNAPYNAYI